MTFLGWVSGNPILESIFSLIMLDPGQSYWFVWNRVQPNLTLFSGWEWQTSKQKIPAVQTLPFNSNLHFPSPRKCYIMCHPFPIFFVLYGGNFSIVIEDSDSYSEVSMRKSWTFADIHNSKWKALRINLEKTQIPVADLFIEGFWRNWLCFFKAINYLCWKKKIS